jgi:hypothetical protein
MGVEGIGQKQKDCSPVLVPIAEVPIKEIDILWITAWAWDATATQSP